MRRIAARLGRDPISPSGNRRSRLTIPRRASQGRFRAAGAGAGAGLGLGLGRGGADRRRVPRCRAGRRRSRDGWASRFSDQSFFKRGFFGSRPLGLCRFGFRPLARAPSPSWQPCWRRRPPFVPCGPPCRPSSIPSWPSSARAARVSRGPRPRPRRARLIADRAPRPLLWPLALSTVESDLPIAISPSST